MATNAQLRATGPDLIGRDGPGFDGLTHRQNHPFVVSTRDRESGVEGCGVPVRAIS